MKKVCIRIDEKLLKKLKIKAVKEGVTLQSLINAAIETLFKE